MNRIQKKRGRRQTAILQKNFSQRLSIQNIGNPQYMRSQKKSQSFIYQIKQTQNQCPEEALRSNELISEQEDKHIIQLGNNVEQQANIPKKSHCIEEETQNKLKNQNEKENKPQNNNNIDDEQMDLEESESNTNQISIEQQQQQQQKQKQRKTSSDICESIKEDQKNLHKQQLKQKQGSPTKPNNFGSQKDVEDEIYHPSGPKTDMTDRDRYNKTFVHTYSDIYQIKSVGGVVVNQRRYYKLNDTKYKFKENRTYKYLLPKKARTNCLKTIILDMDETLIYTFPEIYVSKTNFQYKTVLRPHVLEFLNELRQYYEIVLFTAADEDYTRRILIGFDIIHLFDHLLFRQHMTPSDLEYFDEDSQEVQPVYTKDLEFLGRQLRNVCIIDDKKQRFERQPNNGIEIPKWVGKNKNDECLLILRKFFLALRYHKSAYERFNFSKGIYKNFRLKYYNIEDYILEVEKSGELQHLIDRYQIKTVKYCQDTTNTKFKNKKQYYKLKDSGKNENSEKENNSQESQERELTSQEEETLMQEIIVQN